MVSMVMFRSFYKFSLSIFLVFILLLNISYVFLSSGGVRSLYHFEALPQRFSAVYHYTSFSLFESGFFARKLSTSEISSYIYDTYSDNNQVSGLWTLSPALLLNTVINHVSGYEEKHLSLRGRMGVAGVSPKIYAAYGNTSSSPYDYRNNIDVTYRYFSAGFEAGLGLDVLLGLFILGEDFASLNPREKALSQVHSDLDSRGLRGSYSGILAGLHTPASTP